MSQKAAIVIPARWGSKRLPGKPLKSIAGKSMLERVYNIAHEAIQGMEDIEVIIATDDKRIQEHAESFDAQVVMTPESCPTGSDRVMAACEGLKNNIYVVLNLQGDTPLMPPSFIRKTLEAILSDPEADVATPVINLSWKELDKLREAKKTTPFTGTTAILDNDNNAIWFSKQIIPGIRKEESLRKVSDMSPVYQHVGLYAYKIEALKRYVALPEGHYEALEGLEQLRMLENGMRIRAVKLECSEGASTRGVDSPEDIQRAEETILARKALA